MWGGVEGGVKVGSEMGGEEVEVGGESRWGVKLGVGGGGAQR